MGLRKYFTVSVKLLIVYSISIICLYLADKIYFLHSQDIAREIIKMGGSYHHMDETANAYDALLTASFYLYLFQIFVIFIFISITVFNKHEEYYKNSIISESFLTGMTFVNFTIVLMTLLSSRFILIPTKILFYSILVFVFIAAFFLAFFLKTGTAEGEEKTSFLTNINNRLNKFGFPHPKIIFSIFYFFAILCFVYNSVPILNPVYKITFLNYLGYASGIIGTIYMLLARHYKMKKMDELKRVIRLEQANNALSFTILVLIGSILLNMGFNIQVRVMDAAIIMGIAFGISYLVAEAKYR